jgi:sugar phosphate isomerase/epimerase
MIELAARVGYDYVGLRLMPVTAAEPLFPLADDRRLLRQTKQQLAATGIRVLDVELFRLTPDCEVGAFARVLDACAELGALHIIAQTPDANVARATEHLGSLCDSASERGLCVNLEFVTWTETPDLYAAATIVGGAHRDNAAILVDMLHFARSSCSSIELSMLPRRWLRYAQVCDAPPEKPTTDEGLIFAARNERLFLGEGGLDLRPAFAALPEHIPYSIEIPRVSLARQVGVEELARRALVTTRCFIDGENTPTSRPLGHGVSQLEGRR